MRQPEGNVQKYLKIKSDNLFFQTRLEEFDVLVGRNLSQAWDEWAFREKQKLFLATDGRDRSEKEMIFFEASSRGLVVKADDWEVVDSNPPLRRPFSRTIHLDQKGGAKRKWNVPTYLALLHVL
jgi:hypothetical protein